MSQNNDNLAEILIQPDFIDSNPTKTQCFKVQRLNTELYHTLATISFLVGALITNMIKVYLISVFQHGSSSQKFLL